MKEDLKYKIYNKCDAVQFSEIPVVRRIETLYIDIKKPIKIALGDDALEVTLKELTEIIIEGLYKEVCKG